MTTASTTPEDSAASPAVGSPLDRQVRAPDPERAAFEAAMAKRGYHMRPALYRDGTYRDTCYSAGWDAWQAARPKRAAVGAAMNVAAALAQRAPLAAFGALENTARIGHRRFARVYDKADEDTRLLAVKLVDALRAL